MLKFCFNRFDDKWLKEKITVLSDDNGECPLCRADSVPRMEASQVGGYFNNLLSMYEIADSFEVRERLIALFCPPQLRYHLSFL
jgi:hypothetical protein